jgi:hypothetical protein
LYSCNASPPGSNYVRIRTPSLLAQSAGGSYLSGREVDTHTAHASIEPEEIRNCIIGSAKHTKALFVWPLPGRECGPIQALFVWPLPGRECGPIQGGHPARDQYRPLKKVDVRLTPSYDPIPAQTHLWLVLRPGNETSPPESWNRPRAASRCHLLERRGARLCGRQAGSGGGVDKEEEDERAASTATPPGGNLPKAFPPAVISS